MVAIATPDLSFTIVELKICESYGCGRSFLRPVGAPGVCCASCEQDQKKQKQKTVRRTFEMVQEDEMSGTENLKSPAPPGRDVAGATHFCAHPGCKKILGPTNISGKCTAHRSHVKSSVNRAVAEKTNGHAIAGKTNDNRIHLESPSPHSDGPHNGHGGQAQLVVERAKHLLADLPLDLARLIWEKIPNDDKMAFCVAWVSGQN
jgi:hypothetical protein